ncbi:MAG TPA: GtrA family protein, partial [Anaerolineae bacterium]
SNSHFNPLLDSLRIYFVLLRFSAVSVLSAVIDNLVFIAAYHLSANIASSQVIARAVSVLFNYNAGRHAVFQAKQRHVTVFPKYLLLVLLSGTASYALIRLITSLLPVPVVAAKLIAETLLFFANFAIQRDFIFVSRD